MYLGASTGMGMHGTVQYIDTQSCTCRNVHLMTAKTEDLSQVNGWIRRLSVTKLFPKLKLVTDNCLLHSSRRANWEPNEGLYSYKQAGTYIYSTPISFTYVYTCVYMYIPGLWCVGCWLWTVTVTVGFLRCTVGVRRDSYLHAKLYIYIISTLTCTTTVA